VSALSGDPLLALMAAEEHIVADHEALRRVWLLADWLELGVGEGICLSADSMLAEVAGMIRRAVTGER